MALPLFLCKKQKKLKKFLKKRGNHEFLSNILL